MREILIPEMRAIADALSVRYDLLDERAIFLLREAADELEKMSKELEEQALREFQKANRGVFLSSDATTKINDINKDREEKGLSPL